MRRWKLTEENLFVITPIAWCLVLILAVAGCGTVAPPAQVDEAQGPSELDEQAVLEAHQAWTRACERGDVDTMVGLLDREAHLLFHPRRYDRFDELEETRQGLEAMFARLGESSWSDAHVEVHQRGDVAWLTSHFVIEWGNSSEPFVGRGTEVWSRSSDGWRLAHGHWSPDPER
jgi:ketosteroid isomerase-like protein